MKKEYFAISFEGGSDYAYGREDLEKRLKLLRCYGYRPTYKSHGLEEVY